MRVGGEFEGGEARGLCQMRRGHLINGGAGIDVTAGGFFHAHSGEEGSVGPRVITRAIVSSLGIPMIQTAHDLDAVAEGFQRSERLAKFEIRAAARGPPMFMNGPVREINEPEPLGCAGCGGGQSGGGGFRWQKCFQ